MTAKIGRPAEKFPREHTVLVRLSDAECAALKRALAIDYPGARKPALATYAREVLVAGVGAVLDMTVRRDRIDRDAPASFAAWRSAKRATKTAAKRRRRAS